MSSIPTSHHSPPWCFEMPRAGSLNCCHCDRLVMEKKHRQQLGNKINPEKYTIFQSGWWILPNADEWSEVAFLIAGVWNWAFSSSSGIFLLEYCHYMVTFINFPKFHYHFLSVRSNSLQLFSQESSVKKPYIFFGHQSKRYISNTGTDLVYTKYTLR